jgi:hypothetical protein
LTKALLPELCHAGGVIRANPSKASHRVFNENQSCHKVCGAKFVLLGWLIKGSGPILFIFLHELLEGVSPEEEQAELNERGAMNPLAFLAV